MFNLTLRKIIPNQFKENINPERLKQAFDKLYLLLDNIIKQFNLNAQDINNFLSPPATIQTLAATDDIAHQQDTVEVIGKNGAVTLISEPTISAGYHGERLLIIGTDDVNTVTLQDETNLSGSLLDLGGSDVALDANATLYLVYSETNERWSKI